MIVSLFSVTFSKYNFELYDDWFCKSRSIEDRLFPSS